jgi:hypothetical protein
VIAEFEVDLAAWRAALASRDRAVRQRNLALRRARRQLRAARGGVSERRWRRLVGGDTAVRTLSDSQAVNRALRRRPAVELGEARLAEVDASTAAAVRKAELAVGRAAGRLVAYGPLGCRYSGRSLTELRRLARRSAEDAIPRPNRPTGIRHDSKNHAISQGRVRS